MKHNTEYRALGGLLWREAKFVQAYIANGGNTTAAKTAAGYLRGHPNPFQKERVRDALRREFTRYAETQGVQAAQVIAEIAGMAFAPLSDPDIRPQDKLKALEMLARHLGLFTDNINLNRTDRVEVEVSLEGLTEGELLLLEQLGSQALLGEPRIPTVNGINGSSQ